MLATDPRTGLVELKYGYTVQMQCNIDARGRRVRIFSGVVCCAIAVILAAISYFRFGIFSWLGAISLGILVGGLFQIFEGMKGWCVVRAVGIKTRI
jgi:hypothetical protein